MAALPAVLIHESGAWMSVHVHKNPGLRYSSGVGMTDVERDAFWRVMSKSLVDAAPVGNKPQVSLVWLDTTDLPHWTALSFIYRQDDLRGRTIWTSLTFFSETHMVVVAHGGTPPNEEAGLDGLDLVGPTFRFE
jgi:hypothetical protein